MNISAISAYTTKKNTKPVSFGELNWKSITYPKLSNSEGEMTVNGQPGYFTYQIYRGENKPDLGVVYVKDPRGKNLATAMVYLEGDDPSKSRISEDTYSLFTRSSDIEPTVKAELLQDVKSIVFDYATHIAEGPANPALINKDTNF